METIVCRGTHERSAERNRRRLTPTNHSGSGGDESTTHSLNLRSHSRYLDFLKCGDNN
ncbi:uncharacterized protein G2W53_041719 [Senna tora]|uniref:Uncharacterized protein n=1 Tax=Senna tora TaxID=362788 RepID=A0A834VY96_9FABA|nr:uncharacterized protein G2W53_041719 [Senna tora]